MEQKKSFPMIYVMRHSERCDLVWNAAERSKIEYKYDAPITSHGHEIAYKTGLFFKDQMECLKNQKIGSKDFKFCIVSSPFYRCLQTAIQVCKGI